jgi:hypothetical protein
VVGVQRGQERGKRLGRVLAVAVEPDHEVGAQLERAGEPGLGRAAVATVLLVPDQVQGREACPDPAGHRGRPVGAAVVDDHVVGGAGDDGRWDAIEDARQRRGGVVSGDRDDEPAQKREAGLEAYGTKPAMLRSMVSSRPYFGCQPSSVLALVMSGMRRSESS